MSDLFLPWEIKRWLLLPTETASASPSDAQYQGQAYQRSFYG